MPKAHKDTWMLVKAYGALLVFVVVFTVGVAVVAAATDVQAQGGVPIPGADSEIVEFDHDGMHYTVLSGTSATRFTLLRTEPTEEYRARQAVKKQD